MPQDQDAWLAERRKLWLRPDAKRWLKPDWRNRRYWVTPPAEGEVGGNAAAIWSRKSADVALATNDSVSLADLWRARTNLARLRWLVADLKFHLVMRDLARKYRPDQPRVLRGNPDGGQWTTDDEGGGDAETEGADFIRVAQFGDAVTDADGNPYYTRGGHHEVPISIFKKWNLQRDTRRVFRQATTGPVDNTTVRLTPDGPRWGNIWEGARGGLHGVYNDAVTELSRKFFEANGIKTDGSNMTPDQARALLKEIRLSEDPRIRDFNLNIRRIRRLQRFRGGGGDDD